MAPVEPATLRIEVVYCAGPGQVETVSLQLTAPACVADALLASGLLARHGWALEGLQVGVWSRSQGHETLLRDRDRVEIYRPLHVDPKEARRLRYKQHRPRALSGTPRP